MASINKVIPHCNLVAIPKFATPQRRGSLQRVRGHHLQLEVKTRTAATRLRKPNGTVWCFDRLAEIAGEYLKRGRPVYVEGRLKTRKWQDKDSRDNYTTEIVVSKCNCWVAVKADGGGGYGGGRRPEDYSQGPHRHPAVRLHALPGTGPVSTGMITTTWTRRNGKTNPAWHPGVHAVWGFYGDAY